MLIIQSVYAYPIPYTEKSGKFSVVLFVSPLHREEVLLHGYDMEESLVKGQDLCIIGNL